MADEQVTQVPEETVAEARALGWRPKDQFKGDPAHWVDADEYVRRGQQIMPILKQNNQRLSDELATTNRKLNEALTVINELKELGASITKERVQAARRELLTQIANAKKEGDVDLEVELTDKLTELKAAAPAPAPAPAAAPAPADGVDPDLIAWQREPGNEWFGTDRRRTMLAIGIAQELRNDPMTKNLSGVAFYRLVGQEVKKTLGEEETTPAASKVASAGRSSSSSQSTTGGKGYANLPPEAKEACDRQAKRFVGTPGFKTEADYRAHYSKLYFAGDE